MMARKKGMSMEDFMQELVGVDFYTLVFTLSMEQQVDFEEDNRFTDRNQISNQDLIAQREIRFAKNRKRLSNKFKIKFPDPTKQPR